MGVFFKSQHGAIKTSVMVFVVMLWILTVFAFFAFQSMEINYEEQTGLVRAEQERVQNEQDALNIQLTQLQALVGFFEDDKSRKDIETIDEVKVDLREEKKLITSLNKLNRPLMDEERGTRSYYGLAEKYFYPDVDDIQEANLLTRRHSLNIENVLLLFEERIQELQKKIDMSEQDIENVEETVRREKSHRDEILTSLNRVESNYQQANSDLDAKTKALQKILDALEDQDVDEDEQTTKLKQILADKKQALEESKLLEEQIAFVEDKLRQDKQSRKKTIRDLQAKKYGKEDLSDESKQGDAGRKQEHMFNPLNENQDGKVVYTDPKKGTIYIDLGEQPNVIPGLKFDVYRVVTRGQKVKKGRISIQKVMNEISAAIILEQKSLDPIVGSDFLVNPVFSTTENVHFAFAGNFSHEKENLKKMIEKIGGVVEEVVGAKTNFVVIGQKKITQLEQQDANPQQNFDLEQDGNYRAARNFGITLMTEDQLLQYIGD